MTLLDLLRLMAKNWKLVVVLPIVFSAVCAVIMFITPAQYQAKATLAVTGEAAAIGGLAESVAAAESTEGIYVKADADATKKQIVITSSGPNPQGCVSAANTTAARVSEEAAIYDKVLVTIVEAESAKDASPSTLKYALMAFLVGLFAAMCIVATKGMIRQPIKSVEEAEDISGLRVLGTVSASASDLSFKKLVAGVDFATVGASSLCVVPVDEAAPVKQLCEALACAMNDALCKEVRVADERSRARILAGKPDQDDKLLLAPVPSLSESEEAFYLADASCSTLIVIQEWLTPRFALEGTLRDLSLTSANIVGFVMISSKEATFLHIKKGEGR